MTANQFQLRQATHSDLPEIAALLTEGLSFDGLTIVQTAEELEEEFGGPYCFLEQDVMVAEYESHIIGVGYTYFLPSETKEERCYIFGTTKPEFRGNGVGTAVMQWALDAGADIINDTWAGHDPALPEVAAEFGAGIVCSHTGGAIPRTRPFRVHYGTTVTGVVDDVIAEVTASAENAVALGVPRDRILIDPTHDFGKNTFHGLSLLRHVKDLANTGWPVLMALSNKDFIGETLGVQLTERLEGTLAATALAAADGARMFRVHEVGPTRRVLEMAASIKGDRPPARTVRGLA